jgi:hypothetical protein
MRTLNPLSRAALVGAAALFSAVGAAKASLYGNFVGPNVIYQNVTENDTQLTGPPTTAGSPTGLFGAPLLIPAGSDILTFPNMTFSSAAADGTFEFQDGKLTFNIVPNGSANIHSLNFDEGGAWTVDGPEGDAESEATLLFNNVSITSVNGIALTTPIIVTPGFTETASAQTNSADIVTTPDSGNVTVSSNGTNSSGIWDIDAAFNLDGALASAGLHGQITGISVALNDQLLAQTTETDGLTLATIDKKHLVITPVTSTVPEPTALSLLAGAGLLLVRRRDGAR